MANSDPLNSPEKKTEKNFNLKPGEDFQSAAESRTKQAWSVSDGEAARVRDVRATSPTSPTDDRHRHAAAMASTEGQSKQEEGEGKGACGVNLKQTCAEGERNEETTLAEHS